MVGHDPDDPCLGSVALEGLQFDACGDADKEMPSLEPHALVLEQGGDELGLDRKYQDVGQVHQVGGLLIHLDFACLGHPVAGLFRGGAGHDLVGRVDVPGYKALDHRSGHPAGTDESDFRFHDGHNPVVR